MTIFAVATMFGGEVELHSAEVERETAQMYIIKDRNLAGFGYRQRIPKDQASCTSRGAWESFIQRQQHVYDRAKRDLSIERQRLELSKQALAKLAKAEAQ